MNRFFDKLPFKRLAEKIPAEIRAKIPMLDKVIPFANHIVCGLAVALLITGIAASGIGEESGSSAKSKGGDSKALIGTWKSDYGFTWSFSGGKFTQSTMGMKQTVPYKIKGNSISTEYQGAEIELDFEINGDTLTVDLMGFTLEFERVK